MKNLYKIGMILIACTILACSSENRKEPEPYLLEPEMAADVNIQSIKVKMIDRGQQNPKKDMAREEPKFNTEEYDRIVDNAFLNTRENPLSTFSVDVDTASYSNIRRFLSSNQLPLKDAVRIEEMLNYFPYAYPKVTGKDPVNFSSLLSDAPWNPSHKLLRIAVKAKDIATENLPASNLVLLIDTSGSMADENKLPLLQKSLEIMIANLRPQDHISIVAYAGSAGLILPSTPGNQREKIISAFNNLEAGGSTAGGEGILLAYKIAKENFIKGGNNRVILCTDGDFNVGVSSTSEMERLIEEKRKENVYLTVLGLGMGNYKDNRMETLANKGNGNYAYIDNLLEGKKVLGKEIWGNLFAVAKDVKIQIEFNPAKVKEYRLIGYENRLLAKEDFNDDTKDAGEMGAGQTVTAFYEIVLGNAQGEKSKVDALEFQNSTVVPSDDLCIVKLRYKDPGDGNETSQLISTRLSQTKIEKDFKETDLDFQFASSVIEAGMLLRESSFKAQSNWNTLIERAKKAKGNDPEGYRSEFIQLCERALLLAPKQ